MGRRLGAAWTGSATRAAAGAGFATKGGGSTTEGGGSKTGAGARVTLTGLAGRRRSSSTAFSSA